MDNQNQNSVKSAEGRIDNSPKSVEVTADHIPREDLAKLIPSADLGREVQRNVCSKLVSTTEVVALAARIRRRGHWQCENLQAKLPAGPEKEGLGGSWWQDQ